MQTKCIRIKIKGYSLSELELHALKCTLYNNEDLLIKQSASHGLGTVMTRDIWTHLDALLSKGTKNKKHKIMLYVNWPLENSQEFEAHCNTDPYEWTISKILESALDLLIADKRTLNGLEKFNFSQTAKSWALYHDKHKDAPSIVASMYSDYIRSNADDQTTMFSL